MADPSRYTGFVNFQRYFGSNRDAANREAQRIGSEVEASALDAEKKRRQLERDFNAQAGISQPPELNARGQEFAGAEKAGGTMAPGAPPSNVGTAAAPRADPATDEEWQARIAEAEKAAASGGAYAGPQSLSEVKGYEEALRANMAASQQVNQLRGQAGLEALMLRGGRGPAGLGFNAALAGQAGAQQFARLRDRFGLRQGWQGAEEGAKAGAQKRAAGLSAGQSAAQAELERLRKAYADFQSGREATAGKAAAKAETKKMAAGDDTARRKRREREEAV